MRKHFYSDEAVLGRQESLAESNMSVRWNENNFKPSLDGDDQYLFCPESGQFIARLTDGSQYFVILKSVNDCRSTYIACEIANDTKELIANGKIDISSVFSNRNDIELIIKDRTTGFVSSQRLAGNKISKQTLATFAYSYDFKKNFEHDQWVRLTLASPHSSKTA